MRRLTDKSRCRRRSRTDGAAVAENASIPESDPTFSQATPHAGKFGQLIQVSNELATDTGVDLDSYLVEGAGSNLGWPQVPSTSWVTAPPNLMVLR